MPRKKYPPSFFFSNWKINRSSRKIGSIHILMKPYFSCHLPYFPANPQISLYHLFSWQVLPKFLSLAIFFLYFIYFFCHVSYFGCHFAITRWTFVIFYHFLYSSCPPTIFASCISFLPLLHFFLPVTILSCHFSYFAQPLPFPANCYIFEFICHISLYLLLFHPYRIFSCQFQGFSKPLAFSATCRNFLSFPDISLTNIFCCYFS